MKNKIIASILIIILCFSAFSFTIFASSITYLEGLIITNADDHLQFLSVSGSFYDISSEMTKDIESFCNLIANKGVKIIAYSDGLGSDKKTIKIIGITTAKELPKTLKDEWDAYLIENYGKYTETEGIITKSDDGTFSFVVKDQIYTPVKFEYNQVKEFADLVANTGYKMKIESAIYNDNSILISYMESVNKLPQELSDTWEDYAEQKLEEASKQGVIISYGSDSYMFIENSTNKMYPIVTSIPSIYVSVPIIADQGYQVKIGANLIDEEKNVLDVFIMKTMDGVPDEVLEQIEAADKKRFESILFNIEGYITLDNETDYNVHFNKNEQLGLESKNQDVVKVIKAVANDQDVVLKLEGYINYEETVMDVRTVTLLVDVKNEETLKKLQEAFPTNNNQTQNTTNNTANNTTNNQTNTTTPFSNDQTIQNFFNNSSFNNNSNFDKMYSSILNNSSNSNFANMSELFAGFNTQLSAQSSMLNSGNLNNFNFEEFQAAFNSMSNNMTSNTTQTNGTSTTSFSQ